MSSLRSKEVEVQGVRWHYQEGGDPADPTIVLVHGLGVASDSMVPTGQLLAQEGFHVLAPDLPGFGRSGSPAETLDVPKMGRALADWMGIVGVPRASFLANSLGCQVVATMAVHAPEKAERLVLLNPSADPDADAGEVAKRLARDIAAERPKLIWLHVRDDLRAGFRRLWKAGMSALEEDIYRWAPAVRHPTIVLRGTKDPVFPEAAARRLVKRMPNAILVEMNGAPHAANFSAPEDVLAAVLPFFRGQHPAFPPSVGGTLSMPQGQGKGRAAS